MRAPLSVLKGFCFGHLIHSCLMLGRQILHFTSPDPVVRVSRLLFGSRKFPQARLLSR